MKKFYYLFIASVLISLSQVSLSLSEDLPRLDLSKAMNWEDKGIVYGIGDEKAYYPCVIFDSTAFGVKSGPKYKMWYSDGTGAVWVGTSKDGKKWSASFENEGFTGTPHHVQVIYDKECFGDCVNDIKYKIWYWDKNVSIYSIDAIKYAESQNGISWVNNTPITQDETDKLVTGESNDWNKGSYGPVDVIYQTEASNTGDDPWDYTYVLFFNGTNGGNEITGLAYSTDGRLWTGYAGNPVLQNSPLAEAWDNDDAVYGTVLRINSGYHFWYSGGSGPADEGIGYAFSLNGLTWTKARDPIFHITDDNADHREKRTYTPSVVQGRRGRLRMFYSAKSSDGDYAIGLAIQKR